MLCSTFVINHNLGDMLAIKHSLIKELLVSIFRRTCEQKKRRQKDKPESLNQEEKLQR